MTDAGQIVAAFRDIAATKNLSSDEVYDLIRDGIVAGLVKIYGPNVEAEIEVNEGSGDIEIIVLRNICKLFVLTALLRGSAYAVVLLETT